LETYYRFPISKGGALMSLAWQERLE